MKTPTHCIQRTATTSVLPLCSPTSITYNSNPLRSKISDARHSTTGANLKYYHRAPNPALESNRSQPPHQSQITRIPPVANRRRTSVNDHRNHKYYHSAPSAALEPNPPQLPHQSQTIRLLFGENRRRTSLTTGGNLKYWHRAPIHHENPIHPNFHINHNQSILLRSKIATPLISRPAVIKYCHRPNSTSITNNSHSLRSIANAPHLTTGGNPKYYHRAVNPALESNLTQPPHQSQII